MAELLDGSAVTPESPARAGELVTVYGTGFGWMVWGAALVGWVCKWLTVRYGGAVTYRRVQPFFLGLIFGEAGMRLLWACVALWQGRLGAGYAM